MASNGCSDALCYLKGRAPYPTKEQSRPPAERGVGKGDFFRFAKWTLSSKSAEDYVLWLFIIDTKERSLSLLFPSLSTKITCSRIL